MKIEVLGTERRRRWSLRDKLQIVEETLQPEVKGNRPIRTRDRDLLLRRLTHVERRLCEVR
jgi:transposase-like protein